MKTLIITNSKDATTDLLIHHLGTGKILRLNYDLWNHYTFEFNSKGFIISSPNHSITSQDVLKLYWRKPFVTKIIFEDKRLSNHINMEVKYIFNEIFSFCALQKKAVLVNPFSFDRFGKINQLIIASKYFHIADWSVTWNKYSSLKKDVVTKSLSSAVINKTDVLYTSQVIPDELNLRYPWFLQQNIEAHFDVTILYVKGEMFSFKLDRKLFEGIDWRKSQLEELKWQKFVLSETEKTKIKKLMDEIDLIFGRLDFLVKGKEMYFLEVNPNGQYAWLDHNNTNGLLKSILNIISPDTKMNCVIKIK